MEAGDINLEVTRIYIVIETCWCVSSLQTRIVFVLFSVLYHKRMEQC